MLKFVLAAVALISALQPGFAEAGKLTIERLVASPDLNGASVTGIKFSPDGARVTFLQGKAGDFRQQDLWEYNFAEASTRLLVDSKALLPGGENLDEAALARRERQRIAATGIVEYYWAPAGDALLFPLGGDLYYLPLAGEVRQLTRTDASESDPRISPEGNFVSYTRAQNLYIYNLATGIERRLTSEGGGTISYGVADFAAQEEMYRFTGYWWSPDETHIAFTRIDEAPVALVNLYEIDDAGVRVIAKRYPFAGTPNARVRLFVMALESGEVSEIDLGEEDDIYLARVDWLPDGKTIAFQRQTRDQKKLELIFADVASGSARVVLSETSPTWINLHSDLTFVGEAGDFFWSSERSGYRHLYYYAANGALIRQLTSGDWAVADANRFGGALKAVDEALGLVYFEGFADTPLQKHLYAVPYRRDAPEGGGLRRVTLEEGWHDTTLAADGSNFVDKWSAPDVPPRTAIKSISGVLTAYIRKNALDSDHPYFPYADDRASRQFGQLQASDGTTLHYLLMRPPGFDPSRQYPAILHVYGGPGVGRRVTHKWDLDFKEILARNGYVVFSIDNRGSPNRGKAFEDVLYRSMGKTELEDQIRGVDFLKTLGYIDADRIGLWGGSYGGFMTLMGMFRAADVFAAGAAHAPVTDWRLYDTHYTERYLGDPAAAGEVYAKSSPLSYVDGLEGPLLLIHGMADDNVFFDHSVKLMKALQLAGKPFEMMTYPGQRHRLKGEDILRHNYKTILDFFERRLKPGK